VAYYRKPFRESATNRYCRLFAPSQLPTDLDRHCQSLTALARAMIDDGSRVSDNRPEILVDVGYTYFGQFVAHDLTKDVSSIDEAWQKEPEDLVNLQTPRLDLEVLYGGGPAISSELYEDDRVRLKVGSRNAGGRSFDVCVGAQGERILADDRGGENLILRQMTAVFARLHNFAVDQFHQMIRDPEKLFERARQQTQWQFQWLVCRDYLPTLLNLEVYQRVFRKRHSAIQWDSFSIPIEFSAAAMRFGHAMARPNYLFGFGKEMFLQQIFGRTSDRGALADELEIKWGFFFQGASPEGALTTRPIDTRLSEPFHELPPDLIGTHEVACPHSRIAKNPTELAVRTLLRGAGLRLASGQTVARALSEPVMSGRELRQNCDGEETEKGRILREAGLLQETPLWYYILKESELRENGNRLGPVGSHLIAETIYAALRSDPNSYLNQPNGEDFPPIWEFPDGRKRIYGLSELFRLAPLL
jgi:hypothetical protein